MKKLLLLFITIMGWFALIAQLYININSNVAPVPELITRYFSYFTIDTNLTVALCSAFLLLKPTSRPGIFFSQKITATAITVYILIVGIVYNLILRFLWNPQGLQKAVDELLHTMIPLLFLFYWLVFVPKDGLKWKHALYWMIYPLIYGSFVLLRGYFSTPPFYPYQFIDMSKLGISKGIVNTLGFTAIFYVTSLLFISIGKLMNRNK